MKTDVVCLDTPCDHTVTERPRYYPRQLITPDDMTLEQDYFRSRLLLHNRLLHGWGVVCGALVCAVPASNKGSETEPWKVRVKPGFLLGPYGHEIHIDCTRTVDLRTRGVTGITGEPCVEAVDPWCSEVFERRDPDTPLYVAVKYKEIKTRPVRVQPVGCGCEDARCEYSRLRDGYEIGILTDCPDSHLAPPDPKTLITGDVPVCPECPPDPWVVLAEVTADVNGVIQKINNCDCRRLVVSLASFWWRCTPHEEPAPIHGVETTPQTPGRKIIGDVRFSQIKPGATTKVQVSGSFAKGTTFDFQPGSAKIKSQTIASATSANLEVAIATDTKDTTWTLIALDANGQPVAKKENAIFIGAAPPPPVAPAPAPAAPKPVSETPKASPAAPPKARKGGRTKDEV